MNDNKKHGDKLSERNSDARLIDMEELDAVTGGAMVVKNNMSALLKTSGQASVDSSMLSERMRVRIGTKATVEL